MGSLIVNKRYICCELSQLVPQRTGYSSLGLVRKQWRNPNRADDFCIFVVMVVLRNARVVPNHLSRSGLLTTTVVVVVAVRVSTGW